MLYGESACLHNPEAITMELLLIYRSNLTSFKLSFTQAVPLNELSKFDLKKFIAIWSQLRALTYMNWISPFYLTQVRQAIQFNFSPPFPAVFPNQWIDLIVKHINRRDTENELKLEKSLYVKVCSYEKCHILNDLSDLAEKFVICDGCLKKTYCSNNCKNLFFSMCYIIKIIEMLISRILSHFFSSKIIFAS